MLLEFSDLNVYRENEDMTVLLCRNGHRSEMLVLFDNTIAYIPIALQVGDLSEEQVGAEVWAENDV